MQSEIIDVTLFTADDFINTSKPYDYLYQFKDDKFMLGQMRERMKAHAAAVGVRGFVGLWNAYLEAVNQQRGVKLDNATAFEDQELELFSGQYICDEYGVVCNDRHGYEVNVCRHPILPVQRLINIDTGEERLKIAFKKGRVWRSIVAEKSVIASGNSIIQLSASGVMVNAENAKALSTYLLEIENLNYNMIPEQRSVGRLGWVGEGFSPYVDNLAFDGENNFKHIFQAVKTCGSREVWVDAMRKVREEESPGRLFLAASFASVLLEPCGLLPFFFHAWGGTEVGKTVGLMIAASVWACPKMGEYITTFNSTLVGQEMMASFLNSLPMCVDELQIQSSGGIRDFDRIIYQLTEGVGKTRGAKSGGLLKTTTWKNCIITNGEHPISNANSGGGAVNRIIEFECEEKIYSDLVGLCALINSNYGHAGREFVEYLQDEKNIEETNALQKEFYRELLKSDSTDKQAASASAILAADAIATKLIFKDDKALKIEDVAKIMTKKKDVDSNERAYEFILEMVERNINHFKSDSWGEYRSEVWGRIEAEYICIIKSVFNRELANEGYNATAFLSWAKRQGLLICEAGKHVKKVRIVGTPTNCVCIRREKIDLPEIDESDLLQW